VEQNFSSALVPAISWDELPAYAISVLERDGHEGNRGV